MSLAITVSALGLLVLAAAVSLPTINPEPSCRNAAERAKPIGSIEACMRVERSARHELNKRWSEFTASEKAACIPLATMGATPTYTELLSCLEMKRDTRLLHEQETVGRGEPR